MEITIEFEDKEDKDWFEANMKSIVDEAIFALGATVRIDGWYHVFKGYNHAYHCPKGYNQSQANINDSTKQVSLID